MPWKSDERRREVRRKKYAEQIESGIKRDWGKIEALCPVCGDCRFITKNTHGITKLPKDDQGRIIRRCRSCSKVQPDAKRRDIPTLVDEHRRRRMVQKSRAVEYLGRKCLACGYAYDGSNAYAFDFHHRDQAQKEFLPTSKNYAWDKCKRELDKCDLLCAICHRKKHSCEY